MNRLVKLLVLSLSLLAFNFVKAQTFAAGFYAGATMSGIEGLEANNDNSFEHLGLTAAGTLSAKVSRRTKLEMELRFFQRGASQSPRYDSLTQQFNNYFKLTLNYADIVIGIRQQLHFNIRNQAKDMYGFVAGVSAGYLMGYSYEVEGITYKLSLHPVDVSPYIGLYYNITPHFYIEGRFSNSVNSALVQSRSSNPYFLYYSSFDDGHNMCFSVTLGFVFGGSRR